MKELDYNEPFKKENNEEEVKRLEIIIKKVKTDRDKSDKIRGIAFGLSTYMAIANFIDIGKIDSGQFIVRNFILISSTLLYIKHKQIGDKKNIELLGFTGIKNALEEKTNERQKTIQK